MEPLAAPQEAPKATQEAPKAAQEAPKPPQDGAPRKKKIKTTKDVNGVPQEVEIEVDDVAGPTWGERKAHRLVNSDLLRIDAPVKVTGRAQYTHDIRLPGMVWGRVLCSPWPQGTVKVDIEAAQKLAGVEAVIVLKEKIGFLGDPLVAVAARTPELADDALRALKIELTAAPFVLDRTQALAEGAAKVRKNGNRSEPSTKGKRADVEAALANAASVVEASYSVPVQHHASLETHGVVVDYRGGDSATIYASTQSTFSIADDAAKILGIPENRVTAIVEHMGGGFGAKFGLHVSGAAACRLAKQLKKPVHLLLTRADEFLAGGNRSGRDTQMKGGIAADGTLVALITEQQVFGGVGNGSGTAQPYIYTFQKSSSSGTSIYTHLDSSVAMRAPGHPQASFAMESLIDELAYAQGLDLLEVRKKNVPNPAWVRQLERAAREIGWYEHPHRTQPGVADGGLATGIGFAIATWGGGGSPECEVDVVLKRDGSVTASVGTQDLGTGTRTYIAAIVAEEFGLALDAVHVAIGDSRLGRANGSGGSTTTSSLAPAVKHAAFQLREKFAAHLVPVVKWSAESVRFANGRVEDANAPGRGLPWAQACGTLPDAGLSARGVWQANLAANGVHGAQAAKVEVDTLTGRVRVLKMVGVQDCGLPMNRLAVKSQLNGGMIQALSYALLEERVVDATLGIVLSTNLEDYKVAGASEMPELVALIDDDDTREAVIGMAEPAIIPGHSAIANAVANACGARVRSLPLTPDKVLAALGKVG